MVIVEHRAKEKAVGFSQIHYGDIFEHEHQLYIRSSYTTATNL